MTVRWSCLSAGDVMNVGRSVVSVVERHSTTAKDQASIVASTVSQTDDRPTVKQLDQRTCQTEVSHVDNTHS